MGLVVETFHDLGITRVSRWIFTCYLIHDGGAGAPIVVDAGLPGLVDDLVPVLAGLGSQLGDVAAIVATHAHSDHVAGAPALSERAGAPVLLPAQVRAYVEGATPRTPSPAAVARIWPTVLDQPFDRAGAADAARGARVAGYGSAAGMRWPDGHDVAHLDDGGPVPGAPDWEVVPAPGHTDDSVAFFHPGSQVLLSGDAVLSVGGRAWLTPETVDDVAGAATAERLRALDVRHLLPGHGRPVHGRDLLAGALGPDEGPGGVGRFAGSLARCLLGGRAGRRS